MKIIGKPGDVIAPKGWLEGPFGKVQVSSVHASFAVGSIPTCKISLPIEFLDKLPQGQTDDVCQVIVTDGKDEYVLFTGYVAGPRGRISGTSVNAGISLIHIARDLDQCRIMAPGMHPASVLDFNYVISNDTSTGFGLTKGKFFTGKGKMPEEIIKNLVRELGIIQTRATQNTSKTGSVLKEVSFAPAIALLNKIVVKNGTINADIVTPLTYTNGKDNTINAWVDQRIKGSFASTSSLWDVLSSIFTTFGLQMICDNQGVVSVSADMAGMTAPKDNELGASYITGFDWASLFTREILEVNLITDNIGNPFQNTDLAGPGAQQAAQRPGTLATYPDAQARAELTKANGGKPLVGGSLSIQIPGWLSPLGTIEDTKALTAAQVALAQMYFYLERSKLRTISISGPLAPNVIPGTTATFSPFSKMKAKSGMSINTLTTQYTGYCYKIDHVFDGAANVLQTNFSFRNVSNTSKKETIASHPIFSDVTPFVWE